MSLIFVTGIGTGIGKTLVSAIVAEALGADYWKPVQAGDTETDSELVRSIVSNPSIQIHPEAYLLKMPASPHIAARQEGLHIELNDILSKIPSTDKNLVVEGPGGLMVPLNESQFVIDLIKMMNAKVILVARNYLGSINHSLLTAMACKQYDIPVLGWIFNDRYLQYEEEIAAWTGLPRIASIPYAEIIDQDFVKEQAGIVRKNLII
jgi:dethiobiotin synthetase